MAHNCTKKLFLIWRPILNRHPFVFGFFLNLTTKKLLRASCRFRLALFLQAGWTLVLSTNCVAFMSLWSSTEEGRSKCQRDRGPQGILGGEWPGQLRTSSPATLDRVRGRSGGGRGEGFRAQLRFPTSQTPAPRRPRLGSPFPALTNVAFDGEPSGLAPRVQAPGEGHALEGGLRHGTA